MQCLGSCIAVHNPNSSAMCGNTGTCAGGTNTAQTKCTQTAGPIGDSGHGHEYKLLRDGEFVDSDPQWHCHCGWPLGQTIYNTSSYQFLSPWYSDPANPCVCTWRVTLKNSDSVPIDSSDVGLN